MAKYALIAYGIPFQINLRICNTKNNVLFPIINVETCMSLENSMENNVIAFELLTLHLKFPCICYYIKCYT